MWVNYPGARTPLPRALGRRQQLRPTPRRRLTSPPPAITPFPRGSRRFGQPSPSPLTTCIAGDRSLPAQKNIPGRADRERKGKSDRAGAASPAHTCRALAEPPPRPHGQPAQARRRRHDGKGDVSGRSKPQRWSPQAPSCCFQYARRRFVFSAFGAPGFVRRAKARSRLKTECTSSP